MAFRRQDIPKTTRKGADGERRRIYPRYLRDPSILPKIDLATGYLEGMIGRRRAELSSDVIVELFGDPKVARCLLASLASIYRYRSPAIAEIAGDEAAARLAGWDLFTPADLRHHVYAALQAEHGGFASPEKRRAILSDAAEPLGIDGERLDGLLNLDAERNAILIRSGERPDAKDVVARYNAMLTVSVLRQGSSISLHLPGLDRTAIATICSRHDVEWRWTAEGAVRLEGRRDAHNSWSRFGARLSRCASQLLIICTGQPSGEAVVHVNGEPLRFVLDQSAVATIRPKHRAAAGVEGTIRATQLLEELGAYRRRWGIDRWTFRRCNEPLVVDGALVLPELVCVRGDLAVAIVAAQWDEHDGVAAVETIDRQRPLIALGLEPGATTAPALASGGAEALLRLLDTEIEQEQPAYAPLRLVAEELAAAGWIGIARLEHVVGAEHDLETRLGPLTEDGDAVFIAGFGLCRTAILEDLRDEHVTGPVEVPRLRAAIAAHVGDGSAADALALHLLSATPIVVPRQSGRSDEERAAA